MAKITEVFHSLQGEGIHAGAPSVFIRFSGCNLRCSWCDTPYSSWNPEGEEWTWERIEKEILKYPAKHVVFTGGEPCMFPQLPDWVLKAKRLGKIVTVETAGTIAMLMEPDLLSLSPKLSNSSPDATLYPNEFRRHEALRRRPDVLAGLVDRATDYQVKFVVESDDDYAEICEILKENPQIDRDKVYLMPQARDPEVLADMHKKLAKLCIYKGLRLGQRLHVQLWGDKRGV